ncbi:MULTISPECIES: hypothetical protein [unclassified Streptomyces]|uniref:hypothetical protein n=1 Tax=unclassified Streptomyces TaxID=2593676 RepID=UPI00069B77D6|nr:hypothetical protein [Streptomyces sp. CNQ-509]
MKAEEFSKGRIDPYGGRGFSEGVPSICLTPEPGAFARRTEEITVSWKIEEDDEDPAGADTDEPEGTSAFFTLEVSDPRYLEHFAKNAFFQTAFTGHLPGAWPRPARGTGPRLRPRPTRGRGRGVRPSVIRSRGRRP